MEISSTCQNHQRIHTEHFIQGEKLLCTPIFIVARNRPFTKFSFQIALLLLHCKFSFVSFLSRSQQFHKRSWEILFQINSYFYEVNNGMKCWKRNIYIYMNLYYFNIGSSFGLGFEWKALKQKICSYYSLCQNRKTQKYWLPKYQKSLKKFEIYLCSNNSSS